MHSDHVIESTMLSTTPALRLSHLEKRFGSTYAVRGVDLEIPQGQLYALLGPNGAGKTTTLRMIAGLLRPDAGNIEILGKSVVQDPKAAKQVLAYLPDDPMLYAKLTALEHLEFVSGLWGMPAVSAANDAELLLKKLGLWDNARQTCESFSRGMKQKLALAAALIHQPRLMILDEPLTGLDAAAARLVKDMLLEFVQNGGTVILTTHILEVAERLAEQIGIIAKGQLIAAGTLEELRAFSGETGSLEDVFLELTAVPA